MNKIFITLLITLVLGIFTPLTPVKSVEDNILYAGTLGNPGKILKVDLNTFQVIDRLSLNDGENAHALDLDNEYLYVGTLTTPAKIIKIRLSDFKRIDEVTLPSEFMKIIKLHIFGDYLYVGLDSGQVARVDLSTLSLLDSIMMRGSVRDIAVIGSSLYISTHAGVNSASLQKLRVSNLSRVDGIQLSMKLAQFMLVVDSYLYIASNDAPAGLMKIDLDIFQEVASVNFLPDDKQGIADFVVRYSDYLLSNGDSHPGRIYRTSLSNFTWLDYLDLSENRACDIEISGKYAYVSNVENQSSIVKVDLDNFREIAKIKTGEGPIPQMVLSRTQQKPTAVELSDPLDITEDSMKLNWTESIDEDFINYTIYISTTPDTLGDPVAAITSKNTTSYTVTGLQSNTIYYFTIRAFDRNRLYADSNKVSEKTISYPLSLVPILFLIVLVITAIVVILFLKRGRVNE